MSVSIAVVSAAAAGLVAQLVDGALGMGFGTVSAALLTGIGLAPVVAAAALASASLVAGTMSAAAHTRFGNVHWPTATRLAAAGSAGGFVGAWALASLAGLDGATPVASAALIAVGAVLAWRGYRGRLPLGAARTGFTLPTGLVGGFAGAVAGGWGPVTVPVLMAVSRLEPRRAVGSAAVGQAAAAAGALLGFWIFAPQSLAVGMPLAEGLAIGGALAAPFAAWLTGRVPAAQLTATIGMLAVALHLRALLADVPLPWPAVAGAYLLLAALWALALTGPRRRTAPHIPEQRPERVEAGA
ncbi:TSUP family transporter [Glycomyces mayteni]|uniref:Probable membrane transporter protein n=1 Tax=Glycomyces mayteni TaxID=543887 RepID=A0ABW2D7N4_9ACTN